MRLVLRPAGPDTEAGTESSRTLIVRLVLRLAGPDMEAGTEASRT